MEQNSKWFSDAFSQHAVGWPYFAESRQFSRLEDLATQSNNSVTAAEKETIAVVTQRVLDLSLETNAASRFGRFVVAFVVGGLLIVGGAGLAVFGRPAEPVLVERPTPVELRIGKDDVDAVRTGTQCKDLSAVEAVAVRGTFDEPVLRLYGDGCATDEWVPGDLDVVVVAA